MTFKRFFFLIIFLNFFGILTSFAEETDQFTLPPKELQDIGPAASAKLFAVLNKVIEQTNAEIRMVLPRAHTSRHAAAELALRQSDIYLADLIYKNTGPGFPKWLRGLPKESKPIFYREIWPWKTVYWLAFSQSPFSLISLAPTIRMYHYYFGTDKLGHFFMQGHTYFKMYRYFLEHGKSAQQAHAAIVLYGQILEQTYLGTLINGVYSNGDLSANYAGWKFYMNLAHRVTIGKHSLPPLLILENNQWKLAKHVHPENLLKPYLSDNLNEAFNPCRYSFTRSQIRKQVKQRCAAWIQHQGISQKMVVAKLKETSHWHGEEYGHWLPKQDEVSLRVCFENENA